MAKKPLFWTSVSVFTLQIGLLLELLTIIKSSNVIYY